MVVARNLCRGHREIWGWRPRAGKRFLERGQRASWSGERCELLQRTADFGRTKSAENAKRGNCSLPYLLTFCSLKHCLFI